MKKELISDSEYLQLLDATKSCDNNDYDVDRIIGIYDYLKDKKVNERNWDGTVKIIENAHLNFLKVALNRIYFSPEYDQATYNFLKSDYLSSEIKKEIYNILNGSYCSKKIKELLNSEKKIDDFSGNEIDEINSSLHKVYDKISNCKKKLCDEICEILDDYIFILDGVGPIKYIKERVSSELPIMLLEKSSIPCYASYYSGCGVDRRYLGEDHLFSLYKKYVKFYPESVDEFVKMVKSVSKLTPTEFVTNYLLFVNNGFNSNFKLDDENISNDNVSTNEGDLGGTISTFSLLGKNRNTLDRKFELETHSSIRNKFFQKIEKFKSIQAAVKKEKILNRRVKQD